MNLPHQVTWLVTVALLFTTTQSGCTSTRSYGPYSSSEVAAKLDQLKVSEPVFTPPLDSSLASVFYYIDLVSDGWLVMYLGATTSNGSVTRVAKLRTSLLGPALDGAMENSRNVSIAWANGANASTCSPRPDIFPGDEFSGTSYQTCLVWRSGRYWFLLYSILQLDETIALANSLERIR